MINLKQKSIY